MIKTIANNLQIDIQEGDWVDVEPGTFTADPVWGNSLQVTEVLENASYLMANIWNGEEYENSAVDLSLIIDNYRKVPFE